MTPAINNAEHSQRRVRGRAKRACNAVSPEGGWKSIDGEALMGKRQWHGAITASALNLGEADAVEKILACEVAFDGKASGIKLSKTALFCRFDNQSDSY